MESSSWAESLPRNRIKAIQELTNGHVLTDKLREMLSEPEKVESDLKSVDDVVVQVLRMFDSTLSILRTSNLNGIHHIPSSDVRFTSNWNANMPKDFGESSNTMTPGNTKIGCKKRRKNVSTITKITSVLVDDGYAWRKYGQKMINNSIHPRNYYRCTHKLEQGCEATKQVQKIDDESYKIIYNGPHTCNHLQTSQIVMEATSPRDKSFMISFETNTLMENNKVGTCFSSIKDTHKEGFPSLCHLKHEHTSSSDHHSTWGPVVSHSQVPLEPMSMIFNCEDMVSSPFYSSTCTTHAYRIDGKIESHDYGDFIF